MHLKKLRNQLDDLAADAQLIVDCRALRPRQAEAVALARMVSRLAYECGCNYRMQGSDATEAVVFTRRPATP